MHNQVQPVPIHSDLEVYRYHIHSNTQLYCFDLKGRKKRLKSESLPKGKCEYHRAE